MTQSLIIPLALALLLAAAVVSDIRSRRIPNALVLPAWGVGIALGFVAGGVEGGLMALQGFGVAFGVSLIFWLLGWLGAGDVKLLAAVGAFTGIGMIGPVLAAVAFSGLILALGALLYRGYLGSALKRYWVSFQLSLGARRGIYLHPGEAEQEVRLPYAVAIAAGTLAAYGWVAL